MRSRSDWNRQLRGKKPGDIVRLRFEQRGQSGVVQVKLMAAPQVELVPFEKANLKVSPSMKAFRSAWLESQARGVGR